MSRPSVAIAAVALGAVLLSAACGPQACPQALLSGQLVEANGALVVKAPNGELTAVDWSNYSIRRDGEDLIVTEFLINVLAREGDLVNIGGGFVGNDGQFKVCGQVEVVP
jgi:hypothetical protein